MAFRKSYSKTYDPQYQWDLYIPPNFNKNVKGGLAGKSEGTITTERRGGVDDSTANDINISEYKIWSLYQTKMSADTSAYVQLVKLIKSYGTNGMQLWNDFETLMTNSKLKDTEILEQLKISSSDSLENGILKINRYQDSWLFYDTKCCDEVQINVFEDIKKMTLEAIRVAKKKVVISLYPKAYKKNYELVLSEIDCLINGYTKPYEPIDSNQVAAAFRGLEKYYKVRNVKNLWDLQNLDFTKVTVEIEIDNWY